MLVRRGMDSAGWCRTRVVDVMRTNVLGMYSAARPCPDPPTGGGLAEMDSWLRSSALLACWLATESRFDMIGICH